MNAVLDRRSFLADMTAAAAPLSLPLILGSLQVNGISAAGWKFRANDATGAPVFDSDGIINVMTLLGSADNGNSALTIAGNGSWNSVTSTSITYTLSRATNVLYVAILQGKTSGASGTYSNGAIFLDGVNQGTGANTQALWDKANGGYTATTLIQVINGQAAGSHTTDLRINPDTGQTWINFNLSNFVFRIGG